MNDRATPAVTADAARSPGATPTTVRRPAPALPLRYLETLWLQVTGTLCNLACRHCFVTCGPKNDNHPFMSLGALDEALATGRRLGVKEYYFTGGEPFMHPDILAMIDRTLAQGPLTILTNGVLIDRPMAEALGERFASARYSFDLRVSLDGSTAAENDPIRGSGTFEGVLECLRLLADVGMNPVLTVTEVEESAAGSRDAFRDLLRGLGLDKPRVKFLAPFRIGREARRGRAYQPEERLEEGDLLPDEFETLQCATARTVTANGVWPCPILIEHPEARLADRLEDALGTIRLAQPACHTCHVAGISCRT